MNHRDAKATKPIAALLVLLMLLAVGCKVSPRTLEKWRNRPGSEENFVMWMLDPELSAEVRSKAIEMLIEQYNYEGPEYLPRVADLPQDQRDQAIMDALPRITALYEGAEFTLGTDDLFHLEPVQVRDSAFILMETTETPEVREALLTLIFRWLQEKYNPCITYSGKHSAAEVLTTVGPTRGMEVVAHFIESGTMEEMICHTSSLAHVSWLPEVADQVAEVFINRWENRRPEAIENQLGMIDAMLSIPESRSLKTWVFINHLANSESEIMVLSPDAVMAFVEYVRPLSTAEDDVAYYETMIQIREGNLRWMAFEDVVRLQGAPGLDRALNAIPEAGVWSRWAGEMREDGLKRAATYICGRPIRAIAEEARGVFEQHLESPNLVARAIAIRCLAEIGNEASIELMEEQSRNRSMVPAWGTDEESTISAIIADAIERIRTPRPDPADQPPAEQPAENGEQEGGQ